MEKIIREKNKSRNKWSSILETLQNQEYKIITAMQEESRFSKSEIGFNYNGSQLKFCDNGDLFFKNQKNEGIFISKKKNTLLLNSKNVVINSNVLNVKTRPDGFKWNGYYLNPEVLGNIQISITKENVTRNVPLFIKSEEDKEIEILLEDFGVL